MQPTSLRTLRSLLSGLADESTHDEPKRLADPTFWSTSKYTSTLHLTKRHLCFEDRCLLIYEAIYFDKSTNVSAEPVASKPATFLVLRDNSPPSLPKSRIRKLVRL